MPLGTAQSGSGSGNVKEAHVCMTNRKGASLKENIVKDHFKSGRSGIYEELRAWPTSPSTPQYAFEGYNFRESVDKEARMTFTGKLGDTIKAKPANPLLKDRRHYHVSDEILQHYECALRTNMKAR